MSDVQVTVAVPVKDRRERMLRCLEALLDLDHPSYEVLVLDNESSDGTAEACRERAESAGVPVRVEVVGGTVGAVRNHAARVGRGELIAYTDSDCMPEPGWLREGVKPFADPRVGIVCGRTLPEFEPTEGWFATIEVTEWSGLFESCNVFFRRAAFAATEGFDEVVGHFWEDTAAGRAMLRRGWGWAWAHDAVVRHDVTYPGFVWHLKRNQRHANAARVIRAYPELRRELMFGRVFLSADNAKFDAAIAGAAAALAARHPAPLLLALPYLHRRREVLLHPKSMVQSALYDASKLAGLLRGAVRHRALVL